MMLKFLLTDKNECRVNNGGCIHYCHNTIGSYYCYCKTGYQLYSDRHRCIGTYIVNSQLQVKLMLLTYSSVH